MKNIQWFPGHMTKSMRQISESAKLIDGVICVVDARAPFSCINKKLGEIFLNKPIIFALNKSDLVERADLNKMLFKFKEQGLIATPVIATDKKSTLNCLNILKGELKEKVERNALKGKPIRVSVIGIPNTGKSTFINSLCGQKKAITGDKAGVTRSTQWVKINGVELLDTPGTMPPSFDSQELARKLAYIGSINDDILDKEEICLELIKELMQICPEKLNEKYKIQCQDKEGLAVYEEICKKRGFLLRGGDYDYTRCANAVIDDFRKGRIGKICLE